MNVCSSSGIAVKDRRCPSQARQLSGLGLMVPACADGAPESEWPHRPPPDEGAQVALPYTAEKQRTGATTGKPGALALRRVQIGR